MESINYMNYVQTFIDDIKANQGANLEQAASYIAESCVQGGRFYVFGSGHSHMIAEELYLRAGGLAWVKGILPPELMLHEMANKSTQIERLEGYSKPLLHLHKAEARDTILIISNSGRNSVPVEMCLAAKEIGMSVIVITSLNVSKQSTSRHSSDLRMFEIADVVLDNMAPQGDAAYYVPNFATPTGAISTVTGSLIAQAITTSAIGKMVKQGIEPPVFKSSNVDGADAYNDALFEEHYGFKR